MTLDELLAESLRVRKQIEEMVRSQQSPAPATQAPASALDSETTAILDKPIGNWSQNDKDKIRSEINGVLRGMGR
jgi:hypothetical protein